MTHALRTALDAYARGLAEEITEAIAEEIEEEGSATYDHLGDSVPWSFSEDFGDIGDFALGYVTARVAAALAA